LSLVAEYTLLRKKKERKKERKDIPSSRTGKRDIVKMSIYRIYNGKKDQLFNKCVLISGPPS